MYQQISAEVIQPISTRGNSENSSAGVVAENMRAKHHCDNNTFTRHTNEGTSRIVILHQHKFWQSYPKIHTGNYRCKAEKLFLLTIFLVLPNEPKQGKKHQMHKEKQKIETFQASTKKKCKQTSNTIDSRPQRTEQHVDSCIPSSKWHEEFIDKSRFFLQNSPISCIERNIIKNNVTASRYWGICSELRKEPYVTWERHGHTDFLPLTTVFNNSYFSWKCFWKL